MSDEATVTPAQDTPPPATEPTTQEPVADATTLLTDEAETPTTDGGEPEGQEPAQPVEYTFTLPEGVTLDEGFVSEAKALFAETALPADAAQKYVDMGLKLQQQTLDAATKAYADMVAGWRKEAETTLGAEFSATLGAAREAIKHLGDADLRQMLDQSGYGNHVGFIKFFAKVGRALKEDTLAGTTGTVPAKPTEQERLAVIYSNSPGMNP